MRHIMLAYTNDIESLLGAIEEAEERVIRAYEADLSLFADLTVEPQLMKQEMIQAALTNRDLAYIKLGQRVRFVLKRDGLAPQQLE